MNNKKIGLSIAGLIVISIVLFFFFTNKSSKDLSNYIPKDALMVSKIDLLKMGQKIKFKELVDFKFFKAISKGDDGSTEKIFQNPLETGIAFQKSPYIFVVNTEKDDLKPMACFIFGISNKEKFLKFFKSKTDNDYEMKNEDDYTSIDFKEAKMFVNDKFSIFMGSPSGDDINYKKIYANLLDIKDEDKITSNQSFVDFQKNESDFNIYFNKKNIEKLVDLESSKFESSEKQLVNKFLENCPIGATLSFDEDVMRLKYYNDSESKNSNLFLQKSGLKSSDLQMFAPDGKPLSYFSLNANMPEIFELLKDNNDFERGIEDISNELGLSKDDILSLFDGKISASLIDIKPGVEQVYDDYTYPGSPYPTFMIHAGVKNTAACQRILEMIQSDEDFVYDNGVYSTLFDNSNQQYVHFLLKGDDLIFSNSFEHISDFRDGKSWSTLKESSGGDLATKNPFLMYADLKYDTYKDIIEEVGSSSEKDIAKELLKNMNNIVGYSNPNETTIELKMKPKNMNSLWYIFTIVEDVYKKAG
jgi:hypothetical protein